MTPTILLHRNPVTRALIAVTLAVVAILITLVSFAPQAMADDAAPNTNTSSTGGVGGEGVLPTGIPAPPDLDVVDASRRNMTIDPAKVPNVTPGVSLITSWPLTGAELWVPPREARLTFDAAVRPVDVTVQIYRKDDKGAALVKRTVADPDLKTIRFSVQGITPGNWVVVWQAGETQGTYQFKMNTPPRAMGGQNHREHPASTPGSDRSSGLALGLFPVLAALALLSRRNRMIDIVRGAMGVAVATAAIVTAALTVVTTTMEEFATSLATATVWSWVALAAVSLALILPTAKTRGLMLVVFGIGVMGTVPRNLPLADATLAGGISLAAAMLAVIVCYLALTSLQGQKWSILIKLAASISLGALGVFLVFVANNFDKPIGLFVEDYNNRLAAAGVLVVSLLLAVPSVGAWLKAPLKKSIAGITSPATDENNLNMLENEPLATADASSSLEAADGPDTDAGDSESGGSDSGDSAAESDKSPSILDRADAIIEKSMKATARFSVRAAKWLSRTVVRVVVLAAIAGGLVYSLVIILSVPNGGAGL